MRIQRQRHTEHDPANGVYGDCYRTCVAMILDMDRDDVPHFSELSGRAGEGGPSSQRLLRNWLEPMGLGLMTTLYPETVTLDELLQTLLNSNGDPFPPVMLVGQSGRFDTGHVVVVQAGEIVADPSGSGVVGPVDGFWWVEAIVALDGRVLKGRTDSEQHRRDEPEARRGDSRGDGRPEEEGRDGRRADQRARGAGVDPA